MRFAKLWTTQSALRRIFGCLAAFSWASSYAFTNHGKCTLRVFGFALQIRAPYLDFFPPSDINPALAVSQTQTQWWDRPQTPYFHVTAAAQLLLCKAPNLRNIWCLTWRYNFPLKFRSGDLYQLSKAFLYTGLCYFHRRLVLPVQRSGNAANNLDR